MTASSPWQADYLQAIGTLARRRIDRRLNQAAAAAALGLSERSFRRREVGEGHFTAAELFAYARQLGLWVALVPVAPAPATEGD